MLPKNIGRYAIQSEIGGNERGTVYRATDPENNRLIALKLLKSQFLYTITSEKKFFEAAEKLRRINHPAVLPILDFGDEDNRPFLTMPLMEGGNLTPRLSAPLTLEETVQIFSPLSDALDMVAAQGLFHADLKPNNVLFSDRGDPMLADLGLKQIIESLSFTKSMLTNAQYISPEQVRRRPLTSETHVYSLAAILFHTLAGRPLFIGATDRVTSFKHVSEKPISLRSLNPQISNATEAVLFKALSKKPEMRQKTCQELIDQLQATLEGALTLREIREERQKAEPTSRFPNATPRTVKPTTRKPAIRMDSPTSGRALILSMAAFVVVCLMAMGILAAIFLMSSSSP